MTKQDRYDQLVSEIKDSATVLSDFTPFADYDIRDYLMYEGVCDEQFAHILMIKVSETINAKLTATKTITQPEVEALATAHNLAVMWENANASVLEMAIEFAVKKGATEPSLVALSRRIVQHKAGNQFRVGMATDPVIGKQLKEALSK